MRVEHKCLYVRVFWHMGLKAVTIRSALKHSYNTFRAYMLDYPRSFELTPNLQRARLRNIFFWCADRRAQKNSRDIFCIFFFPPTLQQKRDRWYFANEKRSGSWVTHWKKLICEKNCEGSFLQRACSARITYTEQSVPTLVKLKGNHSTWNIQLL